MITRCSGLKIIIHTRHGPQATASRAGTKQGRAYPGSGNDAALGTDPVCLPVQAGVPLDQRACRRRHTIRLPLQDERSIATEEPSFQLSIDQLPLTSQQVADGTREDPTLSKVSSYTLNGWPNHM